MRKIKKDLFDVAKRIKEVGDYTLFFNEQKLRYEIHSRYGLELALADTPPTGEDIFKLRRTRRENIEILLEELERENIKAEKQRAENVVRKAQEAYFGS